MKKPGIIIFLSAFSLISAAQDTIKVKGPATTPAVQVVTDTSKKAEPAAPIAPVSATAKDPKNDTTITDMGIAVAPSNIRFRTKPGATETKYLTITNDTYKPEKFKISVGDFDVSEGGGTMEQPANGVNSEYGLMKWISITPGFIELKPGEAKKVGITLKVPDDPSANHAAWGLIMVDQAKEREAIVPPKDNKNNIVMGVIPVMGFGVHVYQNPPNVRINKVEIVKLNFTYNEKNKFVSVTTKNVGDGIGFCKIYIDLNNLSTGFKDKVPLKQFTIFPGRQRDFEFVLPGTLPKGKYIATAVLDFGSNEEIEAAEVEFKIE